MTVRIQNTKYIVMEEVMENLRQLRAVPVHITLGFKLTFNIQWTEKKGSCNIISPKLNVCVLVSLGGFP